jgi:hypothetical protein
MTLFYPSASQKISQRNFLIRMFYAHAESQVFLGYLYTMGPYHDIIGNFSLHLALTLDKNM